MASATRTADWIESLKIYLDRRVVAILFLGFSSGLPIMLIATTLSTWLREEGVSRSAIGLFGFAFAPYTLKFIWAPLIDRMPLPLLTRIFGRRRGWLLLTQILAMAAIWGLGQTSPTDGLYWVAVMAVAVAFTSASQDVVIDAYRIDSLPRSELGAGAGVYVLGYRLAMWIATAGALLIAARMDWSMAYTAMALLMIIGIGTTLLIREPAPSERESVPEAERPDQIIANLSDSDHRRYLGVGGSLLAIIIALVVIEPLSLAFGVFSGYHGALTSWYGSIILAGNTLLAAAAFAIGLMLWQRSDEAPGLVKYYCIIHLGWLLIELAAYALPEESAFIGEIYAYALLVVIWAVSDFVVNLFGHSIALETVTANKWVFIMGLWLKLFGLVYLYSYFYFAKRAIANFGLIPTAEEAKSHIWVRRAVVDPYADFFRRNGAWAAVVILGLISVFKGSDAVLTLMANPFYIDVGFSLEQIAWVSKTFGLWMTLLGGLVGGVLVHRLGMMRGMVVATIAMALSNLMFALVANVGQEGLAITQAAMAGGEIGDAERAAREVIGTSILPYFYALIIIENLSGGIGTAIFVAFLSSLCNKNYSATQYALVTSFMQMFAKFIIVPASGFYADALGWQMFFITSTLFAVPALLLLWVLYLIGLDVEKEPPATEPVPAE